MAGLSAVNAYNTAQAQKAQANFTKSQYESNQKIAGAQADAAKSEGDIQAGQTAEQTKMNVAQQRVSVAATGANVNSGSALALQSDTKWQGEQNQIMIRNNAWRQAWGYNVQAIDYGGQAGFAGIAGANQYNNTLLTGGMNAASFGIKGYQAYNNNNGSFASPGSLPGNSTASTGNSYTDYSSYS